MSTHVWPFLLGVVILTATASAQFNHRSFTSIRDVQLNGNAHEAEGRIRLVSAAENSVGSAWFTNKQRVVDGFETTFSFQITSPGSNEGFPAGADGLAFVLQNSSIYEGGAGGGIGYHGIMNSLAVEFDTYDNNPDGNPEPNDNHISIHTQGRGENSADQSASLGATTNIPNLKIGKVHTEMIRYNPGRLEVFLDDMARPVLAIGLRIDTLLGLDDGRCWIGFTAATGQSWANFDIISLKNEVLLNIRNIFFDTNKSILKSESFPELRKLVDVLNKDQQVKVEIRGHTDNRGGDDHNLKLSNDRAGAVREYLVQNGIAASRVTARGFGAGSPIASNESDDGRAQNRRVEARLFSE
jgi:outer membrane protein OmpA-like peptidoglycan-associated protein